jgi:hypothetical protein
MASLVVYRPIEKLVIVKELEKDYLCEDLITQKQYLVDKSYFRTHYEVAGAFEQDTIH